MLTALEDAQRDTNAPLDDVMAQVNILLVKFTTNPGALTEAEIANAASMVAGFLSQKFSITNISRLYEDLNPTDTAPIVATLADGTANADGSVSAA